MPMYSSGVETLPLAMAGSMENLMGLSGSSWTTLPAWAWAWTWTGASAWATADWARTGAAMQTLKSNATLAASLDLA